MKDASRGHAPRYLGNAIDFDVVILPFPTSNFHRYNYHLAYIANAMKSKVAKY